MSVKDDGVMATFNVSAEIEEIGCAETSCRGCQFVHRRATGRQTIRFECNGYAFTGELVAGTGKYEVLVA